MSRVDQAGKEVRQAQARLMIAKIEEARSLGTILGSLKEGKGLELLTCQEHHDKRMVERGEIPQSRFTAYNYSGGVVNRELKIYGCQDCQPLYSSLSGLELIGPSEESEHCAAYECPACDGFVRGLPTTTPFDDMGALAGSRGTNFYCRVCETHLGTHEIELS